MTPYMTPHDFWLFAKLVMGKEMPPEDSARAHKIYRRVYYTLVDMYSSDTNRCPAKDPLPYMLKAQCIKFRGHTGPHESLEYGTGDCFGGTWEDPPPSPPIVPHPDLDNNY